MDRELKIFALVTAILLIALIVVFAYTSSFNTPKKITNTQLVSYNAVPANAVVYSNNNTILYTSNNVFITIQGGPMNAPSMYSFEIYGLYNPTIVVPLNSKVTVLFVNVDTDLQHNVVISKYQPRNYSGMMGSGMMGPYAFSGSGCPVLPPLNSQQHYYFEFTFTASNAGNYYYLCQVPDHAENGMYGSFVVQ